MMMEKRILLILLLTFKYRPVITDLQSTTDRRNVQVSRNDNFFVVASNDDRLYFISSRLKNETCSVKYRDQDLYVYSVAVLTMTIKRDTVSFVQISKNNIWNQTVLSLVTLPFITCFNKSLDESDIRDMSMWKDDHQDYIFLKVDPQQKYAYVVTDSFMLSFDISLNKHHLFQRVNSTLFRTDGRLLTDYEPFIPYAFDLTNEWAVIVGYLVNKTEPSTSSPHAYIVELPALNLIRSDRLFSFGPVRTSEIRDYNRDYDMSVSINPSGTLIAIGQAESNIVIIGQKSHIPSNISDTSQSRALSRTGMGFGSSIGWLDDLGTLAVLVDNSRSTAWTKAEIHVFENISTNNKTVDDWPDFVLPNNQQTFDNIHSASTSLRLSDLDSVHKPSFFHFLARSNSLLLFGHRTAFYIPSVDAGYRPVLKIEPEKQCVFCILQPEPCASGSYKNKSGIGPCTVCPPGTKNMGDNPSTYCLPCNSTYCLRGASDDVNLADFRSYNEIFIYPDSPIIDDYDDLLVRNFLSIEKTPYCIIISPLFWVLISIVFCFILWLIMFFIKKRQPESINIHRKRVKRFFKRLDIIREGEVWIGGLASLVVFIMILHSCWFAYDYLNSYPIETATTLRASCTNKQLNTKFGNTIQLPLPETDGTYWPILNMLNKQIFTMTIHLINTRAHCDNITVESIRIMGTPRSINIQNCTLSKRNVTRSFSFDLHTHADTIQVKINGPYFIGALQLCLHGQKGSDTVHRQDEIHRLAELNVCTLFYKNNETIGLSANFSVDLIKVINITEPLKGSDNKLYDGRWAPTIKRTSDLSDNLYFEKDGQYLRYASRGTIFTIRFSEKAYFLRNNQSPIIRLPELVFHTFLFMFLLIDILTTVFILYKLWCQPLLHHLLSCNDDLLEYEVQSSPAQTTINVSHSHRH
jgi:hypothetical protein